MDAVYTENYKDVTINIYQDGDAESPRDWDNLGTMVCWHRRYDLGDKHSYADGSEFFLELAREIDASAVERLEAARDDFENCVFVLGQKIVTQKDFDAGIMAICDAGAVMLPLYLFDHSGISMTTNANEFARWDSAGWDWGGVGVVYVTNETAVKEWGKKRFTKQVRARTIAYLVAQVSTYDDYLRGNVYGFTVLDQDGDFLDSCGGFYGDYDGEYSALTEARRAADYHAADVAAEVSTLQETTYA